jgi:hypothetical protein
LCDPGHTRKELWSILNGPRNFLKHPEASMDLNASLELDDEMNAAMLCQREQPPEVQAYTMWFLATRFPTGSPDDQYAPRAAEILAAIYGRYPDLREASPAGQKPIGKRMLQDARAIAAAGGTLPIMDFERW